MELEGYKRFMNFSRQEMSLKKILDSSINISIAVILIYYKSTFHRTNNCSKEVILNCVIKDSY